MTGVQARCAELAALWPALAAALARDAAPGSAGHRWQAAGVVNPDVLNAMILLRSEIPGTAQAACEAAGERWVARDVKMCLLALPRLWERLTAVSLAADAAAVDDATRRWSLAAKRALRLRFPDIPICPPRFPAELCCPHHDDPMAVMLAAGSEGFLRRTSHGLTVEWEHPGRIYCPWEECGAFYGPGEWGFLGQRLAAPVA